MSILENKTEHLNKHVIYLDYQATTPIDEDILSIMNDCYRNNFANPNSLTHSYGRLASSSFSAAKQEIQDSLGCLTGEVVFTSGASEANNLALCGVLNKIRLGSDKQPGRYGKLVISSIEHSSVLECARHLRKEGHEVIEVGVTRDGIIDLDNLAKAVVGADLVSVMWVNNEIGTIQPIDEIAKLVKDAGALFHCDGVQGLGKLSLDWERSNIDLFSLSGHKIYASKGIGGLLVRKGLDLQPLIIGGRQQKYRSGTIPLELCIGLAKAVAKAVSLQPLYESHYGRLRELFLNELHSIVGRDVPINGSCEKRIVNNLNFRIDNVVFEELKIHLEQVAISLGSACRGTSFSHVMQALGQTEDANCVNMRLSFGRQSTDAELIRAAQIIGKALRSVGWHAQQAIDS